MELGQLQWEPSVAYWWWQRCVFAMFTRLLGRDVSLPCLQGCVAEMCLCHVYKVAWQRCVFAMFTRLRMYHERPTARCHQRHGMKNGCGCHSRGRRAAWCQGKQNLEKSCSAGQSWKRRGERYVHNAKLKTHKGAKTMEQHQAGRCPRPARVYMGLASNLHHCSAVGLHSAWTGPLPPGASWCAPLRRSRQCPAAGVKEARLGESSGSAEHAVR